MTATSASTRTPARVLLSLAATVIATALWSPPAAAAPSAISYVVSAHPDDEWATWGLVKGAANNYKVFVFLTQGEETTHCQTAASQANRPLAERTGPYSYQGPGSPVGQPNYGEQSPGSPWGGKNTAECKAGRIAAAIEVMRDRARSDPTLPNVDVDSGVKTLTNPATTREGLPPRRNDSGVDYTSRSVRVFSSSNGNGKVLFFDLGDLDVRPAEVEWAVKAIKANKALLGISSSFTDYNGVAAFSNTGAIAGCAQYGHADHRAVHDAFFNYDMDIGRQYGRTCTTDPDSGRTTDIGSSFNQQHFAAASGSRTGPFQRRYGWLARGGWTSDWWQLTMARRRTSTTVTVTGHDSRAGKQTGSAARHTLLEDDMTPIVVRTLSVAALLALSVGGAAAEGQRFGGATRYETSALLSAAAFPDDAAPGAGTVVLVSGVAFTDALVASGYAGLRSGTVLLTAPDRLPDVARDELLRVSALEVVIIGGEHAVSPDVEEEVRALGVETRRIAGADRYATAARVLGQWDNPERVIVVSALSPADAVAAGPAAYAAIEPVLLTPPDQLPEEIFDALRTVTGANVVGGEDVISAAVGQQIAAEACDGRTRCPGVIRLAGPTRAATAVAVGDYFFNGQPGYRADDVVLTRSDVVADAVAGAPYAGGRNAPILFATDPDTLAPETREWLESNADTVDRVDAYGSPVAVSDAVWEDARTAAGP